MFSYLREKFINEVNSSTKWSVICPEADYCASRYPRDADHY
jgi:hypothetical protein